MSAGRVNSKNPTAFTQKQSLHAKIPPLLLRSRLWGRGQIGTTLRALLPQLKESRSPQSFRKYSAEGIGVRMAAYKLVLIRHGESCWNQENRFCGWFDADLSETGEHEAKRGGQALKGTVSVNVSGPNRAFLSVIGLNCCKTGLMQLCRIGKQVVGPLRHERRQQQDSRGEVLLCCSRRSCRNKL